MGFDRIHDVQMIYRKVLDAMSRPGKINNIKKETEALDQYQDLYLGTFGILHLLLDTEVTYNVISNNEKVVSQLINLHTYSKRADIKKADYIFILKNANKEEVEVSLNDSKIGDLRDPQKSATVILEVEEISNEKGLILRGPGIKKESYLKINTPFSWIENRNQKNIEFPLGIDMIFIDKDANITCLPRTTEIHKKDVS
ncbi:phosphonate metabolism protein [Alkaliphilus metalliredigens QYMF]|uniref:Phosphonate metabolism protein n=1 Tax=Alkaliphilus metalliredigens (strain QYMF) TaxID=293826 RepID=A6TME6_ALKMQ|nr:phosphonate C-P lyase system protein PhnH [Alkaliphilus metalliredigens]ABR47364.1 phosphonate metabolism protein [Alkaliphilus metalliredigens QYMF]